MCWHASMKRAHIGAMKRAHTVAMKRSKLVYTGDTQPKRESVMTPHYLFSDISSEDRKELSENARRLQWCHGFVPQARVLYKTQGRILQWCWSTVTKDLELPSHCEQSTTKSNCRLVPTKAWSMSKVDSEPTKILPKY